MLSSGTRKKTQDAFTVDNQVVLSPKKKEQDAFAGDNQWALFLGTKEQDMEGKWIKNKDFNPFSTRAQLQIAYEDREKRWMPIKSSKKRGRNSIEDC